MIKANSVTKVVDTSEGSLQILSPISFEVKSGESVAIIGASGSGKSTLLGLLAGLDQVTEGEIFLDGEGLHSMGEEERAVLRGNKVGFIFQSFMLVQSLTALENVMLPAEIAGLDNPKALAMNILEQVGLKHRAHHFPNQLSGGEQQRAAIARAFITSPKILFADEPTGNLDAKNSAKIESLLFQMNREKGTTLVLVTHDNELAEHCDRQLTMNAGELVETTDINVASKKEAV
ncbi:MULTISPECIES: ABC transporter ATP-binding protein [Alteromonas]|jgi:putative ABC transport system ATP-binding protein|uniref:ABC transporter ATPase n=1 Tax=Alteromonas mediterranea (strain DSM 17117 / CIP 110805 / LMG 28347 / Deep ecotype) TaxID=1774373 RepID=F2G5T6_ALTMD|nr:MULTISPECIES: ABC transporter ATP-binding protein [Alteromonas]MEA3381175.1 ABC transporter ATP-binding protein [Pseudomonadota bacterium]AEA97507.1 ABC transporter ATPase [Alteromonas mediterranea DE]AGP81346.1 putative lipoprotein releasing system ABC transporter ATP-binding protein [Alteromonas mediterranea MED64]NQY19312.1 ABC transporter ATP-binding protein [Alteromonas sp.]CAH1214602.1 Lipoprotein-releasing system ATP-binding protein LolD [Alteromonas mediterranea]|tara:strand:- start:5202 stop:5900 length:699 start_codon:yes stop_codon:yes gene_type:complete